MTAGHKWSLTILFGVALAAATIHGIKAKSKPLAYVVIDIDNMTDAELFRTIYPKYVASVSSFNGRYIIRTGKKVNFDGIEPKRFWVIVFADVEEAKDWSTSAAQKEINAIRAKSAKSRSFIAEGM